VPSNLKQRVVYFYRFMWSSTGSLDQDQILPQLPAPLKAQMDIVMTRSIFVSIPVFQACEPAEILRMVQGLLTHLALPGDVLLKEGTIGRGLFFIMRGKVIVQGKRPILTDEQQDYVRQKFESFDDDRSGSIDSLELIDAVASLGYEVKKSEIKRMMEEIDADGSGLIELPEFMEMLISHKQFLASVFPEKAESFDDGVELTDGFFGEETVLTGNPSTHTVRAITYSDFFVLPIAVFNEVLELNHGMRKLVDEYAERKHATNKKHSKRVLKSQNTQVGLASLNAKSEVAGAGQPKARGSKGGWLKLRVASKVSHSLGGGMSV